MSDGSLDSEAELSTELDSEGLPLESASTAEGHAARLVMGERPAISLLSNENVLVQLVGGALTLTTHRVRYNAPSLGGGEITSIMLEEIASCTLTSRSKPLLLVLSVLCFFFGLVVTLLANRGGPLVAGLIFGIALAVAYFATAKQVLELASAGATIRLNATGTDTVAFGDFIDEVDRAKNARYLLVIKTQRDPAVRTMASDEGG